MFVFLVTRMNPNPDDCLPNPCTVRLEHDLSVASRLDGFGLITHHIIENDRRTGEHVEKIYDRSHRLVRIYKRSRSGSSLTTFDTLTGLRLKLMESSILGDGSSMKREVDYGHDDRSVESISVMAPNGTLVRTVERKFLGSRTVYHGQTEYDTLGEPLTSVNHSLDQATGHLTSRQQIKWLQDGKRFLVESFSFDGECGLRKYSKVVYYADAGPFIEEIQFFDSRTQSLLRRTISAFDRNGNETSTDILTYNEEGELSTRRSSFL